MIVNKCCILMEHPITSSKLFAVGWNLKKNTDDTDTLKLKRKKIRWRQEVGIWGPLQEISTS